MKRLKKRSKKTNIQTSQNNFDRSQQNRKILKIMITIVIAFFVCWTPLCIYLFLRKFFPSLFPKDKCQLITGFTFYIFPSLSTAINPVILFAFSTNYKQALRTLCSQFVSLYNCTGKTSQSNRTQIVGTLDCKNYELEQKT